MTTQTKYLFAVAVQTLILLVIILFKVSVLLGGTDVLLKIEPIDPRDPLRGDYVSFQYTISNLDPFLFEGQEVINGDTVYVILEKPGKYWQARRAQTGKPEKGSLFLKGKITEGGHVNRGELPSQSWFNDSRIRVIYGIEEYFIPEGAGRDFSFWQREAASRVSIDEDGNAVLKQIFVDDKPWP